MVDVLFRVEADTDRYECVCLSGDNEALGNWDPKRIVPLEREFKGKSNCWSVQVSIPAGTQVHYRYAVCVFNHLISNEDNDNEVAVIRWETHIIPRSMFVIKDLNENPLEPEIFGDFDGNICVDKGWLIDQTEIILKFHSNPVYMLKRSQQGLIYRIKCRTLDMEPRGSFGNIEDSDDSASLENTRSRSQFAISVSALRNVDDAHPHLQGEYGEIYGPEDYIIFRAQTFHPQHTGFCFEVYIEHGAESVAPIYVGHSYLLAHPSRDSLGTIILPITGPKQRPIGQLTVDYTYIRPLSENLCNLSVSYAKYWNRQREALDIGHRGTGSVMLGSKTGEIPENTIASFNSAGENGADFVEFDVQLCKDKSVVLYHDFTVCVTIKKKSSRGTEFVAIPVKDLTLEQLQELRLDSTEIIGNESYVYVDDEADDDVPEDWQPFPTLKQVFEKVDPLIGFDIEVKYPMALASGNHEMVNYFDPNTYVDVILREILRHAGSRRILITCFDPDICSILRSTQNKYPIIFSCMGSNKYWPPYNDHRARALEFSLNTCVQDQMLGISVFHEELIKNVNVLEHIHNEGLILIVWGAFNDRDTIERTKSTGVHGIIYDRIHKLKGTQNIFHLEKQPKMSACHDENEADPAAYSDENEADIAVYSDDNEANMATPCNENEAEMATSSDGSNME